MWKVFTISGLFFLLTACGWHLRGYQPTDQVDAIAISRLSLIADDIYTPLYRSFKTDYENRHINLESTNSQLQLKLLHESVTTRILSLNTELDPAENGITYKINYQITLPDQLPQLAEVQLYRSYTQNKDRIASRDNERQKLIAELRHEAAARILNQLHTLLNPSVVNVDP